MLSIQAIFDLAITISLALNHDERVGPFARLAQKIGAANVDAIRESDILLAVLDGAEVDSGTAAEIGIASGIGLRCFYCAPTGVIQVNSNFP